MHKRLALLVAATLLSPAAFAADWTGWYVGADVGHASGDSRARVALGDSWLDESTDLQTLVTDQWSNDLSPSGSAYGLHVGYNHQFESGFMLGAEFEYGNLNLDDRKSIDGTTNPYGGGEGSLYYDTTNRIEANRQYGLRAKVGYANGPHFGYVTAGPTRVDADITAEILSSGDYHKLARKSENLDGIQWGVGYEYGFNPHWTGRIEYLRTDLGKTHYDTDYVDGSSFTDPVYSERFSQDLEFDAFRIGVNYRF